MTKIEFLKNLRAMYYTFNAADSDNAEAWTDPALAGRGGCGHLDSMLADLVRVGVLTSEEYASFIDSI